MPAPSGAGECVAATHPGWVQTNSVQVLIIVCMRYKPNRVLRKEFILTLVALAMLGWPCCTKAQRHFTTNGRNVEADAFNKAVEQMMKEVGVPGMSLAIIEDNEIVFYHTYGVRERGNNKKVNKYEYNIKKVLILKLI